MSVHDERPVEARAENVVLEAEMETDGIVLNRCECGTAEMVEDPAAEFGFVCAGCGAKI